MTEYTVYYKTASEFNFKVVVAYDEFHARSKFIDLFGYRFDDFEIVDVCQEYCDDNDFVGGI